MGSYLNYIQSEIMDKCKPVWPRQISWNQRLFYRPHGTIFRGEDKWCYPNVSSTLYRDLEDRSKKIDDFDDYDDWGWDNMSEDEQEKVLFHQECEKIDRGKSFLGKRGSYFDENRAVLAQNYSNLPDEDKKFLAEIRHSGGKTNFIDFSMDLNVALFFACCSRNCWNYDGRIILYHTADISKNNIGIEVPEGVVHSDNQCSIFLRPPTGVLSPDDYSVVRVPKDKKEELLLDLWKYHGIRPEFIYRSLAGFLNNEHLLQPGHDG